MMSLAAVLDPLRAANRLQAQRYRDAGPPLDGQERAAFAWQLISLDGEPVTLSNGIEIPVQGALRSELSGELLIVIAGFNHQRWIERQRLHQLLRVARRFNSVFAVEAGTWLVAESGYAQQHRVTTHWEDLDRLSEAFPQLDVRRDRFVIDRTLWSSGGASPALDMMLHYIRTCYGRSLAQDVANVFIYDHSHAPDESQGASTLTRLSKRDTRVSEAVAIMQANIEEPVSIADLNKLIGTSAKTMELIFRQALGSTPKAYYQHLRLQTARKLLRDTSMALAQISVRCGFTSPANFSRAFKRQFGVAPKQFRASPR